MEKLCGWLSPEGQFFKCGYACHLDTAFEIYEKLGEPIDIRDKNGIVARGEYYLEQKGYIKITHEFLLFMVMETLKPTKRQLDWFYTNIERLSDSQRNDLNDLVDMFNWGL